MRSPALPSGLPLAFALTPTDLQRVCRDLAFSEISAMPGLQSAIASRLQSQPISWGADGLALDSLARMQLATASATWCNAYDAGFEDLFLAKRNVADWADVMQRARSSGAQHVTFSSSGSTGVRKHIRHREDVLASEARAWVQVLHSFDAQRIGRVVVLAPTHHIYGFIWGVLLPQALGVPALDADLTAMPELLPGDLLVAVPDQWAWLAQTKQGVSGVQGVSSTAPLTDAVHHQLTNPSGGQRFLVRLLQIYGSSETAGLAWRADPAEAYTLAPGRCRSDDGVVLTLPSGATVAMPVQDELAWVDAERFHLLRRSDQSVQVAGHNVSPAWVAAQLQSHPNVSAAAVRLSVEASQGNGQNQSQSLAPARLKAFVVLRAPDTPERRFEVESWAREQLPWYAAPQRICYGPELPVNAMGKPCDWQEVGPV